MCSLPLCIRAKAMFRSSCVTQQTLYSVVGQPPHRCHVWVWLDGMSQLKCYLTKPRPKLDSFKVLTQIISAWNGCGIHCCLQWSGPVVFLRKSRSFLWPTKVNYFLLFIRAMYFYTWSKSVSLMSEVHVKVQHAMQVFGRLVPWVSCNHIVKYLILPKASIVYGVDFIYSYIYIICFL